jgi:hypothetical protein
MTRSRASARAAGTRTETAVARFLADHVDDRIERRRPTGAKDRGDLSGVCVHGKRVVVEVKDCAKLELGVLADRGRDRARQRRRGRRRRGGEAPRQRQPGGAAGGDDPGRPGGVADR